MNAIVQQIIRKQSDTRTFAVTASILLPLQPETSILASWRARTANSEPTQCVLVTDQIIGRASTLCEEKYFSLAGKVPGQA